MHSYTRFNRNAENAEQIAERMLDSYKLDYRGGVVKLVSGHVYPDNLIQAIRYLCDEYDYSWQWVDDEN